MTEYLESLAKRADTAMVIELYPECSFEDAKEYMDSNHKNLVVRKKSSVDGAFYVRRKDGYKTEIISEREKDRADSVLRLVDLEMSRIKPKKLNADEWSYVFSGARASDIYKMISYMESVSDYTVGKSRGIGSLRFTLKNQKGQYNKYGFANMGVGDYYTLGDNDKISSVRAYASAVAKTLGIKLKVSAKERKVYRVA